MLLLLLACAPESGNTCGEGTHSDDGVCVADGDSGEPDSEADSDADADADSDADADTDSASDTASTPNDADGDGFSAADGDCDDGNGGVHPGATEVCDNGLDDDCDGTPGACGWSGS